MHNNPSEFPEARQDAVYRLGFAARDECVARVSAADNHALPGTGGAGCPCVATGSLAVGATCCKDDQCRAGKCEREVCTCKDDSDCPAGKKCKRPALGMNRFE